MGWPLPLAVVAAVLMLAHPIGVQSTAVVLLEEAFEDANFGSRGWYDTTGGTLSTAEKYNGTRSLECRFSTGGTKCVGGSPGRHLFQETESLYFAYYIKHSTNWTGSGKPYHPHQFLFLTNLADNYSGLAYTHLTAYIENVGGVPMFVIQDGMNIDETRVGQDLTNVTEQRAVAGCNGDSDGYGNGSCYLAAPSVHWNGKSWSPGQVYFDSTLDSPRYKGKWHLVEAYFKLNTIVGGKGARDGIIRYWYDGQLILERTNIVLRTGAHPTMKFRQFVIAPWIGDGSPVDQTYWVDDVLLATARPSPPPTPPGGSPAPKPPTNLRVVP